MWVCGKCFLPYLPMYEEHVKRCSDCLDEFSSPWSDICKKCYRLANSEIELVEGRVVVTPHEDVPPYRGWVWGAQMEQERLAQLKRRHSEGTNPAPENAKT